MRIGRFFVSLGWLVWLSTVPGFAQQLLWESAEIRPNTSSTTYVGLLPLPNQQFVVCGAFAPSPSGTGCRPVARTYCRIYSVGGVLLREQLGRGLNLAEYGVQPAASSGGWWFGRGFQCPSGSSASSQRPYVQRLTASGDTLTGWWLAPLSPRSTVTAALAQGKRLLTLGMVSPANLPGQNQVLSLTCSDTTGQVRWQRTYPRAVQALDYATNLVATPSGGFLLNGQAYSYTRYGYDHYLIETDSGGLFRRQRLFQPLGAGFLSLNVYDRVCNVLALPNAGGYLVSGTADSIVAGNIGPAKSIAYTVRLDTALNVVWTYRHPPALAGTGATSNYAYRLRLLPNGTAGLLLSEVRLAGTPSVYLAQLDVATGRRVAFYTLSSNTQTVVIPYDWQWLGDGTLLLAGKSQQLGSSYVQGYLARFDFRGTPLATARPQLGQAVSGGLWMYPNPAYDQVAVQWPQTAFTAASFELAEIATGRVVLHQAVTGEAPLTLNVASLPPGVYAGRLLTSKGSLLATGKIVVIH